VVLEIEEHSDRKVETKCEEKNDYSFTEEAATKGASIARCRRTHVGRKGDLRPLGERVDPRFDALFTSHGRCGGVLH